MYLTVFPEIFFFIELFLFFFTTYFSLSLILSIPLPLCSLPCAGACLERPRVAVWMGSERNWGAVNAQAPPA